MGRTKREEREIEREIRARERAEYERTKYIREREKEYLYICMWLGAMTADEGVQRVKVRD